MKIAKKIPTLFRTAVFIFSIALFPILAFAVTPEELRQQIQQKQSEIQKIEQQIAAFKNEIKNQQSQEKTLSSQISYMEAQIRRLFSEIRLTETKISAASLRIEELESDILVRNTEIGKQKNNLGEIIRQINEYDQETPLSMVLKNENFSEFLNQVQFADNLQENVKEKLVKIKDLKKELEEQKTEIESQKISLEELRTDLSGKNKVLNGQVDEKETLLVQTKNQEKKYQQMLTETQKKQKQIEDEIFALEENLRLLIDPNSIPGAHHNLFAWPIGNALTQNYGCLVSSFARKSYPACNEGKGNGGFHNGIDIDADLGDPIKAPMDGTISGMGNLGKNAYGKWVTINHGNGLTTLFAHLSTQSVSAGQKVKAGQVIGYAGSTGYSTGAHLHFTVYATNTFSIEQKSYGLLPLGGSVNPMNYL
ncbi:MAG: peptidoglycan DD-metalloendopeptidase family protein [Candidatus Portnoybacteria bacterium]|nr:peptidoglycan DD-metalloendopeptidase family protein [Candidatus Portnoybacteria bacterium]